MFRKTKKAVALAMATLLTVHTAPELVVNAATTGWELVVREQTPIDRVYFDAVDEQTGASYLIGYKDNKVAIADMEGKLVAKTNYTDVGTTVQYKGKTTLTVEQNGMVGLADFQGREVLACTYRNIRPSGFCEGHTLVRYTKMDDTQFLKIDDTYEIEGIEYAYFQKYYNELVIVVPSRNGDYTYDIYDLTGQKKDTINWKQLQKGTSTDYTDDTVDTEEETIHSYCNKEEGREAYAKAKEEWLLAKEGALVSGAESYFADTDMIFSKKDIFSGYQCVGGKMYYFIVAEGDLTKKLSATEADQYDEENDLATIQYVQIYDEGQKLISEGQTVLDSSSITGDYYNGAIAFLVYVLDKEGNLLKFDAEAGCMEKVFDWKKGAIFCKKYDYSLVKRYNKQVYEYKPSYGLVSRYGGKPDLYVIYRTNAMLSVNGENRIYFPMNKSIETYDFYWSYENLFFKSTEDNQTEVYGLSTKSEKICTIKESIDAFGEEEQWMCGSFSVGSGNTEKEAYCLANEKSGKMYFVGNGFVITQNYKDIFSRDLSGLRSFYSNEKGAFAFRAGAVTYDEFGDESTGGNEIECKLAFLDSKNQSIEWKEMPAEAYASFGHDRNYIDSHNICYSVAEQKIYYIDFTKSECKEINLANTMVQKSGTVEGLSKLDGELYIKYSVTNEKKYYGYADLAGNIIYDATVLKADEWEEEIRKFGDYTMYGDRLLDKEKHLISEHAWYSQIWAYDDEKKEYAASDFYVFYSDDDSEDASEDVGFVYDKKTNKVIFDFKDNGKKYSYGKILGDYIILTDWRNNNNIACLDKTTGKIEKEFVNAYGVVNTKNKRYYVFQLNDKQTVGGNPQATKKPTVTTSPQATKVPTGTTAPQVTQVPQATTNSGVSASTSPAETKAPQQTKAPADTVQKGKSYVVGKQTYKVTDATEKTVTFTKTSNKGSSETIPAEVKIKGETYKVTAIADKVYQGNKKIKKIVIGSNVKSIGKNVWKGCKNLTTIQIKSKVLTKVGGSAIKGTSKKLKITVPSGKKKAYQKLWKGKGNDKAKIK